MRRLLPLVLMLTLAACQPATITPAPSLTSSATDAPTFIAPTATQTPRPTQTPTSTMTPTITQTPTLAMSLTPTPLLPTPALPLSSQTEFRFSEFFFDTSGYPNCNLPCWKGLVIGESTSDDVQRMFDTEFGFNGMLNFKSDSPESFGRQLVDFDTVVGAYPMDYYWDYGSEDDFFVGSLLDQDTDILQGLAFYWSQFPTSSVQVNMTPKDFLEQLGEPSQMYAAIAITAAADISVLDMVIIYEEGVVVTLGGRVYSTLSNDSFMAEFCFGKNLQYAPREQASSLTTIYLFDPSNPENPVTEIAQNDIDLMIERRGLVPFERVFGITPEEAAELALQDGDMCLTIE